MPTAFMKCTDLVRAGYPNAAFGNCINFITSDGRRLSVFQGGLRRDAALASTCPVR